jgi:hypothetical protein
MRGTSTAADAAALGAATVWRAVVLGSATAILVADPGPIQDYVQPDTEIEPSMSGKGHQHQSAWVALVPKKRRLR